MQGCPADQLMRSNTSLTFKSKGHIQTFNSCVLIPHSISHNWHCLIHKQSNEAHEKREEIRTSTMSLAARPLPLLAAYLQAIVAASFLFYGSIKSKLRTLQIYEDPVNASKISSLITPKNK